MIWRTSSDAALRSVIARLVFLALVFPEVMAVDHGSRISAADLFHQVDLLGLPEVKLVIQDEQFRLGPQGQLR